MVGLLSQHPPHSLPLWRAAQDGELVLLAVGRDINLHPQRMAPLRCALCWATTTRRRSDPLAFAARRRSGGEAKH